MLLSFLIVFGVLAKFGFPIITGMADRRREKIEEGLRAAEEATKRLEGVEKQSRELLAEAERQQSELLAKAVAESQRIVEAARERSEADCAARLDSARKQIEIEKQKALGELRTTVAVLSVDVAEKVLREKLSTEDNAYIEKVTNEVELKN